MQVILTAVSPDNYGLADPVIHRVAAAGAHIAEIQMYDDGPTTACALLLRMDLPGGSASVGKLRTEMNVLSRLERLSIRTWSPAERQGPPRLALCVTHRPEPSLAVLRAIQEQRLGATVAVMIGNRPTCRGVADQFGLDWHCVGDSDGNPDNEDLVELFDRYDVDYIVLARYMRLIPPFLCRMFAGGRIINLHHGLLPSFPGSQPYEDAYRRRMLTYGASVHFIVPELDAGDQIIHQDTFTVEPGTPLEEIKRIGQGEHEPACLVEGLRRVLDREVELQFHKVVGLTNRARRRNRNGILNGEPRNGTCTMRNTRVPIP
jgi:formyltetrahydrofolate deformylase